MDAWIDHHILNMYAKNPDALRLSGYLYKDREDLLKGGPIWDFDRAMGCDEDSRAGDPTWWDATNITSDTTDMFDHGWYRGLFRDPEFTEAYWARLGDLLDGEMSVERTDALLDEMEDTLAEAAPRNFERWSSYPPSDGTHAGEMETLREWLADRNQWMQICLALEDPLGCRGE